MKQRLIATIAIVALVGAMIFVATRLVFVAAVADEEFDSFIRDYAPSRIEVRQTSSLPMLLSIRFPKSDSTKGVLGFSDRTDVYTLISTSGVFVCNAHVRRNRVCLVTFGSSKPPGEFREQLADRFPKLCIQ